MIKQFFKKVLISYLIIITFVFAPAYAYADEVTDKIAKLQIDLQKKVGDKWTLSPRNKSVGAGVEIGVSQSYPVTATTTATTVSGATTTNTATLTAQRIGSKIFTPTTANIAKRFAGGVATSLVAIAIYDLLGKAVDYVLDPANNSVIVASGGLYENSEVFRYIGNYQVDSVASAKLATEKYFKVLVDRNLSGQRYVTDCLLKNTGIIECSYNYDNSNVPYSSLNYYPVDPPQKISLHTLAQRSQDIASNPNHKDNAAAQSGMQTVVNDMITNNEIDNSYFNDSSISNDTYNDVVNNYLTNNYPNNTYNYTYDTNNNITNVTIINPKTDTPTASTPASTPKPTDSKPFELPAFCDWAKPVCDFIDWVKKEDDEPTELDISNDVPTPTDTNISFGGMCPPNAEINVRIPYANINATLFDWSKWCYNLETFVKPVIILLAAYFSVLIFRGKNESS